MYLIVGLGNPGDKYQGTRHNAGFEALAALAARNRIELTRKRFNSLIGRGRISGAEVILAAPQTYMNLSGTAVDGIAAYFKVETDRLLVLHDDMDVEVGRIKITTRGGPGGHKGVSSIIQNLGESDFTRIKIGVGRPAPPFSPEAWVLNRFSPEEGESMALVLGKAAEAAEVFVAEGAAAAQAMYNRRDFNEK